jgi:serine/threonine protein kinase
MKNQAYHYTDAQLSALLEIDENDLSADEFAHLESCNSCRQRLAGLSGEGAWLDDLVDSVGDVTSDVAVNGAGQASSRHSHAASVVIAVDSSEEMNQEIQCDTVHLDFLDPPSHPELLGRLGRYDIESLIGMGGFGIVFKARDSELNRVVAVKVLAPHLMHSGPARQRFAREAQASAAVVHDHVVPIYDVVASTEACYFVMQYIAGESLQERVDRLGPLPTGDILRIGSQIAAGLQAAHAQGLIHRDVKPGNVLLEDTVNRVMISDFGLARAADDASLTRSGTITGTPHYMSPEQARGQAIDHRTDLFSLGSVLYFMCTGHSPFRAPQMMAVLNRICHETYRPIEEANADVPLELTRLIDRLLHKKPEGRSESAEHVRLELQKLLSDLERGRLRRRRPATRRVWPVAIAGVVLMAVLGLLLVRPLLSGVGDKGVSPLEDLAESTGVLRVPAASVALETSPSGQVAASEVCSTDEESIEVIFDASTVSMCRGDELNLGIVEIDAAMANLEQCAAQLWSNIDGRMVWERELHLLVQRLEELEAGLTPAKPNRNEMPEVPYVTKEFNP